MALRASAVECEFVVDGAKLKWFDVSASGANDREPLTLVLLPGLLVNANKFADAFAGLAGQGIRLCALEWRGHGDSEVGPDKRLTIARCASDLRAFLEHLKVSKVCLLGHSMGGNVMWYYLDRFGDKLIDRCVWVDQPPQITADAPGVAERGYKREWAVMSRQANRMFAWAVSLKFILLPLCVWTLPLLLFEKPKELQKHRDSLADGHLRRSHGWALGWLTLDTVREDNTVRVPKVRRPSLFIGGAASIIPSACVRWAAAHTAGPRRLVVYPVPWGTHTPMFPDPDMPGAEEGKRRCVGDVLAFLTCPEEDLRAETAEAFPESASTS